MNHFDITISKILRSNTLWIIARILLVTIFLSSGLAKLIDFQGGLQEMAAANLHPPILFNILSIITLLTGAILILLNRLVWLAAGMLSVFMFLTILIVHTFWNAPTEGFEIALFFALEHLTVIGGLIITAIASELRKKSP